MSAPTFPARWPARFAALAPLWALEFAVAQLAGRLVAHGALAPLSAHPAGGEALFSEGSRLAMDLAMRHTPAFVSGLRRAVLPVGAWALFALLFALYPFVALASRGALSARETALRALRRAPAAALLDAVSLFAHVAAFLCGLFTARTLEPYAATLTDARASVALAPLAYLLVAGPLHALAGTVMDPARARRRPRLPARVGPRPVYGGEAHHHGHRRRDRRAPAQHPHPSCAPCDGDGAPGVQAPGLRAGVALLRQREGRRGGR